MPLGLYHVMVATWCRLNGSSQDAASGCCWLSSGNWLVTAPTHCYTIKQWLITSQPVGYEATLCDITAGGGNHEPAAHSSLHCRYSCLHLLYKQHVYQLQLLCCLPWSSLVEEPNKEIHNPLQDGKLHPELRSHLVQHGPSLHNEQPGRDGRQKDRQVRGHDALYTTRRAPAAPPGWTLPRQQQQHV